MQNFQKIKTVGRGTFGLVHLFRNISNGKPVVIKQISLQQIEENEDFSTDNEVKVLSMLHHPHIIEYYTSFVEDDILSIVMEYAADGTLGGYLRSRNNTLDQEELLNLFCQILLGLEHIHVNNIIHRDLTSDNIFLTKNHKIIKIGDFGISKILASKTKANTTVGTPCYMSPELCQGRPYNYKSDIWALGCILYEMLTLKKAFEAPTLPNLVMKIMEGRFQTIDKYVYDIEMYKLMKTMLHLKPEFRPSVSQIRVNPLIIPSLYTLLVNFGNINVGNTI